MHFSKANFPFSSVFAIRMEFQLTLAIKVHWKFPQTNCWSHCMIFWHRYYVCKLFSTRVILASELSLIVFRLYTHPFVAGPGLRGGCDAPCWPNSYCLISVLGTLSSALTCHTFDVIVKGKLFESPRTYPHLSLSVHLLGPTNPNPILRPGGPT